MLLIAAPASAAIRYAEPNGDGPAASCPESNPCNLQAAVEDAVVADGDEIVLLPGATSGLYETQTDVIQVDQVNDAIVIHGRASDPQPIIPTTSLVGIQIGPGTTLRRVGLESIGGSTLGTLSMVGGTADRVFVHTSTGSAVSLGSGAAVYNSVLWNSGSGGRAVQMSGSGTATLRNDTAVAPTGRAILVSAEGGANPTLDVANVIADGQTTVRAEADGSSTATVQLANSNFRTPVRVGQGAFITSPAANANQTALPVYVDAPAGGFHQARSSPTIDAGDDMWGPLGNFDIDQQPRIVGPQPDIGADEFVEPKARIVTHPKKRTRKRTAKFTFVSDPPAGASFKCKLDRKPYKPCASPYKKRVRPGRHTFRVRGTVFGVPDATPAEFRWKVLAG